MAFTDVSEIWSRLRSGQIALPKSAEILDCLPKEEIGTPIAKDKMYFTIRLNEMYLSENRRWWVEFDPMVLAVVEFNYGSERVTVPKVIGPSLINSKEGSGAARFGVVLTDTLIGGPYPYRGGDVDLSLGLYSIKRVDYARTILKMVEGLSSSFGGLGEMASLAKAGTAILEGVGGLLGLAETNYLAGQRVALAISPLSPLKSGYSALIVPPTPKAGQLAVRDRRLHMRSNEESAEEYRGSDFVLFSVMGTNERGSESTLPFFPLKVDALNALWEGDDGLKRAKAGLVTAYQQLAKSPDVTVEEMGKIFDGWLRDFETEKCRVERLKAMHDDAPAGAVPAAAHDPGRAVRELGL